jgi:alcohol dehydrogenase class IV
MRFAYSNPPVIHWGAGSVAELRAELDRLGGDRVALVTTRSIQDNTALMGRLCDSLRPSDVEATAVVRQHAPVADVDDAIARVAESAAEAVVSFGGGSPVDTGKVVAAKVAERRGSAAALPHVAIPTTLSVAELAAGAGVTDESGNKIGYRGARLLPDAVIYDAELCVATPPALWLSTGIRALDHAVEGFLAEGVHPFSDIMALEAVRRLFRSLPEARDRPDDLQVRTENQLAAWFSYTLPGPSAAGLSHVLGKQIGARHGIPHGVTSCLLLPHVMRYLAGRQPDRLAELSRTTGSCGGPLAAADDVYALIQSLGLPQHLSQFGLGPAELRVAAEAMAGEHPADDLFAIYTAAL